MGFTICSGFCKTLPAKYGKKGSDKYEYNAYCSCLLYTSPSPRD